MLYHDVTPDLTVQGLITDAERGLTAGTRSTRLEMYGPNVLAEKPPKTLLQRFFEQLKDVMIIILLIAAAISFAVTIMEGNTKEFFEPCLILLIVLLNAALGVYQENKSEKALASLKSMSSPTARVIIDGVLTEVPTKTLVPGDIINIEAGDKIPADCRILKSSSLKCDESILTGESVPVEKREDAIVEPNAPIGDRITMCYSGGVVSYGTATCVVTQTGMETEMGKIANLLDSEEEGATPLQVKLAELGKYLGMLALAACVIIFVIGVLNNIPKIEIFMTAVSLAVSAIPEGLPAIITVILSIGVQRIVAKNAITRKLPAVETLGSTSVICSDKTGTLTKNQMTTTHVWTVNGEIEEAGTNMSDKAHELLSYGTLCSNGKVVFDNENKVHFIGDPTETAIVYAAYRLGHTHENLGEKYPRVLELPFDSDRKLMTTVHKVGDKYISITKGALDSLSDKCPAEELTEATKINEEFSKKALRVIAVAYKEMDDYTQFELESNLHLIGLVGMIDPPRDEVRDAVKTCTIAGIRPVMITGDHVTTASAIAVDLGIRNPGERAITGAELDEMTDEALYNNIEKISVYARVSPENKIRIVKAWQRKGQIVAMTGDGVNDAPALKAADIGCAMGITGTDVAKGAADMILTDDNFATIVDAVQEGRGIYDNIKKVVGFLLGTNLGEVVLVFIAMLLWHQSPLISIQLLWINLVTDSLPAIALGMEPVEKDIMKRKPRSKTEGLFANGYGIRIVLQGIMFGLLSLLAFYIGYSQTNDIIGGRTLAFMVLALSQVVQAYNMRSDKSVFTIGMFTNKKLNTACAVSAIAVAAVMFTPLSTIFGLCYLDLGLYAVGVLLCIAPMAIMELVKAIGLIK